MERSATIVEGGAVSLGRLGAIAGIALAFSIFAGSVSAQDGASATAPGSSVHFRVVYDAAAEIAEPVGSTRRASDSRMRVAVSARPENMNGGKAFVFWLYVGESSPAIDLPHPQLGTTMTVAVTQFGRHATQTTTAVGLSSPDGAAWLTIVVPEVPDAGLRDHGAKAADMILGVGTEARVVGPAAVVGGATVVTTLTEPEAALDLMVEVRDGPAPVLDIVLQNGTLRVSESQRCAADDAGLQHYCYRAAGLRKGDEIELHVQRNETETHVGRIRLDAGMNTMRVRVPGED